MNRTLMTTIVGPAIVVLGATFASAVDHPLAGRKLLLKASDGGGKINFLAKDPNVTGPSAEELATLQSQGTDALLEVCAVNGNQGEEILDIDGFRANTKGVVKFKVEGSPEGVKVITLKPGKTLKIVGKDALLLLDEPTGGVGIRLTIGDDVNCAFFPADTLKKDGDGRVKARRAEAPLACDDVSLACAPTGSASGAFVD